MFACFSLNLHPSLPRALPWCTPGGHRSNQGRRKGRRPDVIFPQMPPVHALICTKINLGLLKTAFISLYLRSEAKRRRSSCNHRGSRPARWALLPSTNRVIREKQLEHHKIPQTPHYWQTRSQLYTAKPCIPTCYHAPLLLAPWWSTFTHVYIYIYEYIN